MLPYMCVLHSGVRRGILRRLPPYLGSKQFILKASRRDKALHRVPVPIPSSGGQVTSPSPNKIRNSFRNRMA